MPLTSQLKVDFSGQQREMVEIIEREFRRAGLPAAMAAAAIVNAYHESRFNPLAIGDGGNSVGLFQLNIVGAGRGMTVAQRQDPTVNTRQIIEVTKRSPEIMGALERGERRVPVLSRMFAQYVERCAACGYQGGTSELDRRMQTAQTFFPEYVSYGFQWWMVPAGALALGGIGYGVYWYMQRR